MNISIEIVASMCHEANRKWCEAHGESGLHKPWEEETQEEKSISINAMRELLTNHAFITKADISMCAQRAWEKWKHEKTEQGWTYNPVKNRELKHHPCLVPYYDQLNKYEKTKDRIYIAMIKMILEMYEEII